MTQDQVRAMVLKAAKPFAKRHGSTGIYSWCKEKGVNRGHLSEFMSGERLPTTDILNALDLEWRIMPKLET
jgi:hypothetical protein